LRSIPGLEFVEMREADRCCGAAGIYSLLQPVLSQKILDFKMRCLAETQANLVVTANPGCLLQLRYGIAKAGLKMEVLHVAELLDQAYGARL
ncbi:MAG: heterodisulfide reductase-related iron-sulfur binding cluster, partial [Candidatus Methylomirabilales bacterium]